jgi:hypothetical protein
VTDKHWAEEVERAITGMALPWRVRASWIEHHHDMCYAELMDTSSGRERPIALSRQEFATVAARRAEIVRQLQSHQ